MTTTKVPTWTREQWDQYADQVRATIREPDFYLGFPLSTLPPRVTYHCPICLKTQSGIRAVKTDGSDDFTATWVDCGHSVVVGA